MKPHEPEYIRGVRRSDDMSKQRFSPGTGDLAPRLSWDSRLKEGDYALRDALHFSAR